MIVVAGKNNPALRTMSQRGLAVMGEIVKAQFHSSMLRPEQLTYHMQLRREYHLLMDQSRRDPQAPRANIENRGLYGILCSLRPMVVCASTARLQIMYDVYKHCFHQRISCPYSVYPPPPGLVPGLAD